MQSIETEVKIRVRDRAALERHLAASGFRLVTPGTLERNTLYDTPERGLRARKQILRVRQYGERWVVTHKRQPENTGPRDDEQHKHRVETETEVEDGQAIAAIFTQLGYQPAFVYEKWRTEYADATGHCVIDDTPIGLFAELEGPEEWIDATLLRFAIPPQDVTTLSYGRLFEKWKQETGSPAEHLTFAAVSAGDDESILDR